MGLLFDDIGPVDTDVHARSGDPITTQSSGKSVVLGFFGAPVWISGELLCLFIDIFNIPSVTSISRKPAIVPEVFFSGCMHLSGNGPRQSVAHPLAGASRVHAAE